MRIRTSRHTSVIAALAGLLAAGLTLGIAEIAAAFVHPRSSPLLAVGAAFIDLTPAWLKEFAVTVFGTYDKLVLVLGMVAVLTVAAAVIGLAATRRLGVGLTGVAFFGAIGAAAAVTRPDATPAWAVPSLLGAVAGMIALRLLVRAGTGLVPPIPAPSEPAATVDAQDGTGTGSHGERAPDRRGFLLTGVGVAAAAAAAGGVGRTLTSSRFAVSSSRSAIRLPPPASPAPAVPAGADLDVPHLPSFFTPNGGFYRIDTALRLPSVPPEEWTLRVHGMVDRELEIPFDDLLARPLIERDITLACVSNPVGGSYVGNARWLGVRLADVLREAGVHADADEVFSRSADGWTCGTPTQIIMDGRDALLAVAMNGKPLPVSHGFPVRMVVPGLYGYVSATKWVVDIELTRFTQKRPYWATRGWSLRAPVKTMSRIDTPRTGAPLERGRTPIAGVAWAQHRGIERVEVRIDDGPWRDARLAPVPSVDTWRQWVHYWDATPGEHQLQVRATDGRGKTQTRVQAPPVPNGASGWHTITVSVS